MIIPYLPPYFTLFSFNIYEDFDKNIYMRIVRFVQYGLIGWCAEVFWTGLGSLYCGDVTLQGRTYLWMFFIYGLAILLEPIHDRIRHCPVIFRGGVYTLAIFFTEYLTGWLLKSIIGVCPWNYGNGPFSINGIITLTYIPVWFIVGLLFEKLHDMLVLESKIQRA